MTYTPRAVVAAGGLATLLALASPADAQVFRQPSDVPIGENYHVEILGGMWNPTPDITISSDAFGIAGTDINFTSDLGITAQRFGEVRVRLRPGRKHRFRIDYVPIRYSAQSVVERRLVFRGIAYDVGVPVSSTITWNAWRFGYEYDIVHRSRGYFGIIVEAKYTEVEASLDTAFGREFTRARAPIPAIGGVLRVYPLRVLGITAEVTGFRLPEGIDENVRGEYIDFDIYGSLNFTENVGAQIGYRSLDLSGSFEEDSASLKVEGIYVAALLRF
ncbi:MAG: hypothetical protein E2P06_13100 [Acidobacteria bacterium]|nr:MAG: hypothetical protein E2P06_13100 [Acidobacteriota bacterium]